GLLEPDERGGGDLQVSRRFAQVVRQRLALGREVLDVPAATEVRPLAAEQDGARAAVGVAAHDRLHERLEEVEVERVGRVGPVEAQPRDLAVEIEEDRAGGDQALHVTPSADDGAVMTGHDTLCSDMTSPASHGIVSYGA